MLTPLAPVRAFSFRSLLGIAIFILLFGGGAFAVIHTARIEKIAAPKIAVFFESYFALIDNKEYTKAWEGETSQHYKEQYPLASYQGA